MHLCNRLRNCIEFSCRQTQNSWRLHIHLQFIAPFQPERLETLDPDSTEQRLSYTFEGKELHTVVVD